MATHQTILFVDDMDGVELTPKDETGFRFAVDGVVYAIDLTAERAQAFRDFVQPYVAVATRVGKLPTTGPYVVRGSNAKSPTQAERDRMRAVREWARAEGWTLADKGRIPTDVVTAYDAAGGKPTTRAAAAPSTPAKVTPVRSTSVKVPAATPRGKTTTKPKQPAFRTESA